MEISNNKHTIIVDIEKIELDIDSYRKNFDTFMK